MIDLNDIALYVQVVRSGSFAEAARRLGTAPNSVSRRVQQLEAQLDTRLMQRSTRKLTLTDAGQAFYERCADAVDGLTDAGQSLMAGGEEVAGLVRVAAPADFLDFFRVEWVADFLAAHPRVRLEFLLSDARADLIAERIDVAFRAGILADSSYVGRPILADNRDVLVASPGYLQARGRPLRLDELPQHDCLGIPHPSGHVSWTLVGPSGLAETVQVPTRFSANTARALRLASVAGLGIALLPQALTWPDVAEGRLITVLPDFQRNGQGVHALYPSRRHQPRAVTAFIEAVSARLNAM
ncbi:LysR family transcriptional regulator [Xanthomonas campestris pv. campestris]|uniref:LysR family transcriptional regulator n=1 Tax=Xanthomonas campestris TaxID=339 RepID=UPI0015F2688B|nr:LysR family transcriptional regulator [Xanthomonas campestris]MCD0252600.1 LysR family transcriptional regulator [Xanthomonas campestris pv. campestris]MCF8807800.1 LysR family transcriptional regulator [Xanthomonas campestris pv. campestris]MDM7674745.1 LysR family transcriptional regulator [Xanthomonas campestris pv. campestris]MDM7678647.1 LysR family transcriptional regulator [Xanthomonas campestris pv. campestris]MDM7698958.1 LysR family transcriptional regulator [Xanthomonas campestri